MSEKELEQLQHFIHLMEECYAEVAKVKDSKDAKLVEEAETNLAETEAAMLQYMYNILYKETSILDTIQFCPCFAVSGLARACFCSKPA